MEENAKPAKRSKSVHFQETEKENEDDKPLESRSKTTQSTKSTKSNKSDKKAKRKKSRTKSEGNSVVRSNFK